MDVARRISSLDVRNRRLAQQLMSSICLDFGRIALFIHGKPQRYPPFNTGLASQRRVKGHWSGFKIRLGVCTYGSRNQQQG